MTRNGDNVAKISPGTERKPAEKPAKGPAKVRAAGTPRTRNHKAANARIPAATPEGGKLRILPVEADDRPLPEWAPPETIKRSVSHGPAPASRPQAVPAAGGFGPTEAPAFSPLSQMLATVLPTPPEIPTPSVPPGAASDAPTPAPTPAQTRQEVVSKQASVLERLLVPNLLLQATACHDSVLAASANEFMTKFRSAADDPSDPVERMQLDLLTLTVHRVARLHAAAELATTAEMKRDLNGAAKGLTGEIPKLIDALTKYRLSRRPGSQQSLKQASKPGNKPASGAESSAPRAPTESQSATPN